MIRLRKNTLFVVVFVVLALFFIGCEGPAGEDGSDGTNGIDGIAGSDGGNGTDGGDGADGADGTVTCFQCHATEIFEQARYDFVESQHSSGDIAVSYAGGRGSCSRCHSHEGFVAFANEESSHNIANPSAWECGTCHTLHDSFTSVDYNLRMTTAASIFDDGTFLLKGEALMDLEGGDALCANCHQSRRSGPTDQGGNMVDVDDDDIDETLVPEGWFFISSSHYGPHHGAQANTLVGAGFAEPEGPTAYPDANSSYHMAAGCTGCHMYDNSHSFAPSLDACNECHATTDFNYGGVQDDVEELLEELKVLLAAAGAIAESHDVTFELDPETGDIVEVQPVAGFHPVVGIYPLPVAEGFFNWTGLEEDRSLGVHNPKYVKAVLKNSIKAIEEM